MKAFIDYGCPNCEKSLHYQYNDNKQVQDCTSPSFEGLVALGEDNKGVMGSTMVKNRFLYSWIICCQSEWEITTFNNAELEEQNVIYRPRDGSAED